MATIVTQPPSTYIDESEFERIDGKLIPRHHMSGDIHSETQDRVKELLKALGNRYSVKALSEWSITRPDDARATDPDYMTPDVLVARLPYERTKTGHLIRPALLAIEILSPGQGSLLGKAQRYYSWGVEHVWIIDPYAKEAYEYHGGNTVTIASDILSAAELRLSLDEIWAI